MTLFGLFSPYKKTKRKDINVSIPKDEATSLWIDGFRAGFTKAYDLIPELRQEIKKKIETEAINETLRRLNGNLS